MTTLEAIVQELQHVPPQHLDAVYELVRSFTGPSEANRRLVAETMRILAGTDDLPDTERDSIDAHMRQLRAELFTRPLPDFSGEADAA